MSRDMKNIAKFLVGVALGKVCDEFTEETTGADGKKSTKVTKKPATLSVRVSAAKQYKELVVDKLLPDEKVNPKGAKPGNTKVTAALTELEESIHADKLAKSANDTLAEP